MVDFNLTLTYQAMMTRVLERMMTVISIPYINQILLLYYPLVWLLEYFSRFKLGTIIIIIIITTLSSISSSSLSSSSPPSSSSTLSS